MIKKIYYVTINDIQKTKLILTQLGLGVNNRSNIIRENTVKEKESANKPFCEKPFYVVPFGVVLNDPERMYHLEIACPSKEVAQMINNILHRSTFSSKISFWQKMDCIPKRVNKSLPFYVLLECREPF